jgi:hypothetical protein
MRALTRVRVGIMRRALLVLHGACVVRWDEILANEAW